ncbi:MAG: hypothetical protein E6J91_12300 [Deltaproteobacteria bacterium]|nr:MAG: hypothetical protein E6J91_12300 [Deltaproteobacteria bacterium]
MRDRDSDGSRALCNELARKLAATPSRRLMEMTLRHLVRPAGEADRHPAQDDPRHATAPEPLVGASDAQERAPRAISIWQPARVDGELRFVRPPASRLGDGFGQRTTIARRKTARRICLFGSPLPSASCTHLT